MQRKDISTAQERSMEWNVTETKQLTELKLINGLCESALDNGRMDFMFRL